MRRYVLCLLLLSSLPASAEPIRVAVGGSVPYVIRAPHQPGGICVHIWELVAKGIHLESVYSVFPSGENALDELRKGRADVAVGPITMTTQRMQEFHLSVPFFVSRLGMLSRARPPTVLERVKPFLSQAFLITVVSLVVVVFSVGLLVWLAERKHNAHMFPAFWPRGIGNAAWFTLATMTGVGYGDVVPTTLAGRVVASIWTVLMAVSLSTLTAGIATAITLSHVPAPTINSLRNLGTARVAVVIGSEGERLARLIGARCYSAPNVSDAVRLLEQNRVDVVLYSEVALEYYIRREAKATDFVLVSATEELTLYCFAVRKTGPLAAAIDHELVRLDETDELHTSYDRWLGSLGGRL